MYRCKECKAIYEERPEFCDCGNDTFEEVYVEPEVSYDSQSSDEEYNEYGEPVERYIDEEPVKRKKKKVSERELREMEEEKRDRKKAMIVAGISLFISLIILVVPPYPSKKSKVIEQSAEKEQYSKLPSVNAIWNDALPSYARKKDPYYNLPVLNKSFSRISPVLKEYLIKVGSDFERMWNSSSVSGQGECRITFVINKDGGLDYKTMSVKSNNDSLDDSVLLVLSKVSSLEVPPDDYKGEKIILSFKKTADGASKVQYPDN